MKVIIAKNGVFEETLSPIVTKTLTDITIYPEYVEQLKKIDQIEGGTKLTQKKNALKELLIHEDEYDNIVELLSV